MLRAYVLAGGLGTRLRARLGALPKILAPFGDGTFLEAELDWLAGCGVNEVVLALGVRAQAVTERILVRAAGATPKVAWTVDPVPLGTGGALALAARDEERTFIAVDGDVLADVDLVALLERHRQADAALTIACHRAEAGGDHVAVEFEGDGTVVAVGGRAARGESWAADGVFVCEPALLAVVPTGRPSDLEAEVLPAALRARLRVAALGFRGRGFDIGTPAGLDRAAREWRRGRGGKAAE
jgi:NDP-sugar pyrophosphorylase family protein